MGKTHIHNLMSSTTNYHVEDKLVWFIENEKEIENTILIDH